VNDAVADSKRYWCKCSLRARKTKGVSERSLVTGKRSDFRVGRIYAGE